jgi:hypothetical protein
MADYRVNVMLNCGRSGEAELYYWSSVENYNTFLADVSRLLAARANMLGKDVVIHGVRVQRLDAAEAKVDIPAILCPQPPPKNNAVDFPTVGTLIDCFSVDSVARRSMILRFQTATSDLTPWDSTKPVSMPPTADMLKYLGPWYEALGLKADGTGPGGPAAGRWCIRQRARIGGTAVTEDITAISRQQDGSGRFVITTLLTNPLMADGTHLHIHGVTGCGTQGLNGDTWTVGTIANPLKPALMDITVKKVQCCSGAAISYKKGAVFYIIRYILVPIHHAKWARTVSKKVGRPFIGTVGRRPSHCRG